MILAQSLTFKRKLSCAVAFLFVSSSWAVQAPDDISLDYSSSVDMRENVVRALGTMYALMPGSRNRSSVAGDDITHMNRVLGYFQAATDAYGERVGPGSLSRCTLSQGGGRKGRVSVVVGAMMRATSNDPFVGAVGNFDAAVAAVGLFCERR